MNLLQSKIDLENLTSLKDDISRNERVDETKAETALNVIHDAKENHVKESNIYK